MRAASVPAMRRLSPTASKLLAWPTQTCGSRNVALVAAMTMSASAMKCRPPPAQTPFTAVMIGCRDAKMPGGELELGIPRLP